MSTHAKKVCSLYKRALRNLENWRWQRDIFRYEATLLRHRFDLNKDEKDPRVAQKLLAEGEEELFQNMHYQPRQFASSPGGVAYGRDVIPPDWVMDYWHPLEKAQYPKYFEKREQMKKEYIEFYEKQYGKPTEAPSH
ncbi:NADH dehydrogenase [ubiquinone] 1 beta subcomplex subunit 9 [Ctenocephalides felis]|uniref:NADH dehydrogenase [ubiquinone] 1 beta subcomplex subunit 9 n=1 Tax=Ctenocephalides felis TaxID=7515 RepID=UPI000E6E343C|nr:NADH dehydrogenase [ubiquinone] 1 beta subcomplex subunit 9 [Ctenocephalides felis]